jgi:hypothetical protein
MPGPVMAARILIWSQGGLLALFIAIHAVAAVVELDDAVALTVVLAVVLVPGVAVTILLFSLAARMPSRRRRVGRAATMVQALLGSLAVVIFLYLATLAYARLSDLLTLAAILLLAAMHWTAFGLLATRGAGGYFHT